MNFAVHRTPRSDRGFFYGAQTVPALMQNRSVLVIPENVRRMSEELLRTFSHDFAMISMRVDRLAEDIAIIADWSVAPDSFVLSRFSDLLLADPDRARLLVNAMADMLNDPMIQAYIQSETDVLAEDDLVNVSERLDQIDDDDWLSADEVRRSLLGE